MNNWFETLDGMRAQAWDLFAAGVRDATHPCRLPTICTVTPDGWPEARTMVLRGADPVAGVVMLHTDLYSTKLASLRQTPRVALHVWDAAAALQIRLQAEVTISSGDSVRALWDKIPDHARQSYGVTPPPGTAIADALDYVKSPDPATFAVLACRVMQVDLVHLGDRHRRAAYSRSDDWAGQWLSP
ncbi:MAG: pyridoxamine 5'-phosphate oxidase family protein [Loktanella sp.]|nr:pyridoxamine 5'-phosphate oxidase family protein [Loktanella sp.]